MINPIKGIYKYTQNTGNINARNIPISELTSLYNDVIHSVIQLVEIGLTSQEIDKVLNIALHYDYNIKIQIDNNKLIQRDIELQKVLDNRK